MIEYHLTPGVGAPQVHGGVPGAVPPDQAVPEEPGGHHNGVAGVPRVDPVLLDHRQPLGGLHLVEQGDRRMPGLLGPGGELLEAPVLQEEED